jgi:NTP pyrophosphatase (non-canonical NTP hydrolase)
MGYMTNGLTFNALRGANTARLPQFRNKHGALAHSKPDGSDWSPAQWLQAVVGELGEYANLRKKHERGDIDAATFVAEAAKEFADIVTYLDILAMQFDIDLGNAVLEKFNEVSQRVGSTVRLDADDWHYVRENA